MFTSIHDCHGGHRERIHNNTLINWSSLGSCVQLVLYFNDTDSELASFAREHRWRVEPVPYAIFGENIYEQLKNMYRLRL